LPAAERAAFFRALWTLKTTSTADGIARYGDGLRPAIELGA
jgi:hypothetical protein